MNVFRSFRASLLAAFLIYAVSCQEEKFTDKGIPEVEITSIKAAAEGGTTFEGRILATGSGEILDHGFLWDTVTVLVPGLANGVYLGPREGGGSFSFTVTADIEKDKIYYARAFIVTESLLSLGNVITFKGGGSIAPELVSVTPNSAVCGDTVLISGKNFSFTPNNNSVWFDDTEAVVISSTADVLVVKVPPAVEKPVKVSVKVSGSGSVNMLDFTMKQPVLSSITPLTGTFGDVVTLTGTNFSIEPMFAKVYFNDSPAEIIEMSRTSYKVKVPPENNVSPAVIKIKYNLYYSFSETFILKQPLITDVTPLSAGIGDTILISGSNFNPVSEMNIVEIGGDRVQVIRSTSTEICIKLNATLHQGSYLLSVNTLQGSYVTWTEPIEIVSLWTRMGDFPGAPRTAATSFAAGGHGYVGTGLRYDFEELNDFWEYEPASDTWTRKADYTYAITYATGFSVDDMGYLANGKLSGSYSKALSRYNPLTETWEAMTPKPGQGSSMKAPGFVINGKAYLPAAGEMYEYSPSVNAWTKKSYPSDLGYFGSGVTFAINGKGYLGIGYVYERMSNTNDFYEYDPVSDKWTKKKSFPGRLRNSATSFTLPDGKGYMGMGYDTDTGEYLNDMWVYNPQTDTWEEIETFPGEPRICGTAFVIGSVAYIAAGYNGTFKNDFWMFDPGSGK
jgi:N-acetylneuraminic acid mutarotase